MAEDRINEGDGRGVCLLGGLSGSRCTLVCEGFDIGDGVGYVGRVVRQRLALQVGAVAGVVELLGQLCDGLAIRGVALEKSL